MVAKSKDEQRQGRGAGASHLSLYLIRVDDSASGLDLNDSRVEVPQCSTDLLGSPRKISDELKRGQKPRLDRSVPGEQPGSGVWSRQRESVGERADEPGAFDRRVDRVDKFGDRTKGRGGGWADDGFARGQ